MTPSVPVSTLEVDQRRLDPSVRCPRVRLERRERATRTTFLLTCGSDAERVALSLGAVPEEEAALVLAGIEGVRATWLAFQFWCRSTVGGPVYAASAEVPLVIPEIVDGALHWDPVDPRAVIRAAQNDAHRADVLSFLITFGRRRRASVSNTPPPTDFVVRSAPRTGPLTPTAAAVLTLREYVQVVWSAERAAAYPETWKRERLLWDGHLLPKLGHLRLAELGTAHFDQFLRQVTRQDGGPMGYHALHRIRAAYQALVKEAQFKGIPVPDHVFRRLRGAPKGTLGAYDVLTPTEVGALAQAAASRAHGALFLFCFYTGTRPSEAVRTDWSAFDWTPSAKAPHGRVRIDGKKTQASSDTVPVHLELRTAIEALHAAAGRPATGPAFTWHGRPIANFHKALETAALRAGLAPRRRVFPYIFRHSWATWLLRNGATTQEVALLLRHTSEAMVRRVYDHAQVVDKVDIARLLGTRTEEVTS